MPYSNLPRFNAITELGVLDFTRMANHRTSEQTPFRPFILSYLPKTPRDLLRFIMHTTPAVGRISKRR